MAQRKPTTIDKAEIKLVGGSYNKKTLTMKYPTPRFIVLGFGLELYERDAPPEVVECSYKLQTDWSEYNKLNQQA
jgi:hypothetical protein